MQTPHITLFIMTEKGYMTLQSLVKGELTSAIDFVVIGRDTNVLTDYYEEIARLCQENAIPYYSRKDHPPVRTPYAFAISWRWLIHSDETALIVLHESPLPKYRGFAPLVNQLINGEEAVAVTALFASAEYDRGDIILQEKIAITYPITIHQAIQQIAPIYGSMVVKITEWIVNESSLPRATQNEAEATYSLWRDEEDYLIDWHQHASIIQRFVDAVGHPYLGASTFFDGKKIRILSCTALEEVKIENRTPGKVIFFHENYPVVVCGEGLLKITEAIYDESQTTIFPLSKFRIRFY